MIAVIFEVEPAEGQRDAYLDIAARLKPELEAIDGFLSVERFESLANPGKMLSLSFFRDEAAVAAWRNTEDHRRAQTAGRSGVFANYRLRVARVVRDYGMTERDEAPRDSRAVHVGRRAQTTIESVLDEQSVICRPTWSRSIAAGRPFTPGSIRFGKRSA